MLIHPHVSNIFIQNQYEIQTHLSRLQIQSWLRHGDIKSTMRYAHDDIDMRMNAPPKAANIEMIEWDVKGQDELALDIPPSKVCNTQGECQQECRHAAAFTPAYRILPFSAFCFCFTS